ncbi:4Fe-4S dicluster domain-containing protein [bacterium]|nr:4Fe-4S dicluster domain-containing protein [bacterium]
MKVTIDNEYCKGCTVCVEVCPVDALQMEPVGTRWQGSVVIVSDIEACIGCMLCELQCPDFAIDVVKPEKKKGKAKPKAEAAG